MKRARESSPLNQLLQVVTRLRALPGDTTELANRRLAPLVLQAYEQNNNAEFHTMLEKSGWSGTRFAGTADMQYLADALPRYQYTKVAELGSGSYATVYKATNRETQEVVAIKKLKATVSDQGVPCATLREISHLKDLKHENIIELKDVSWSYGSSNMYVVLECLDCDLRQHLNSCKDASRIGNIKLYLYQILKAIEYAHSNLVMHRDLKPQNILVDVERQNIKVADFGLARSFLPSSKAYTNKVVTLWYRAPELLLGASEYTSAVDIWSIGCIFAEMVNFSPLFQADTEVKLLHNIFQTLGTPTAQDWPDMGQLPNFRKWPRQDLGQVVPRLAGDMEGLDLLHGLLTYDPKRRLTAADALQHPWFSNLSEGVVPPLLSLRNRSDSSDGSCQSFESALQAVFSSGAVSSGSQ